MVEQRTFNARVPGSSPGRPTWQIGISVQTGLSVTIETVIDVTEKWSNDMVMIP